MEKHGTTFEFFSKIKAEFFVKYETSTSGGRTMLSHGQVEIPFSIYNFEKNDSLTEEEFEIVVYTLFRNLLPPEYRLMPLVLPAEVRIQSWWSRKLTGVTLKMECVNRFVNFSLE